jgi:3-methyladenine DNA glycosylase AlkD
VKPRAAKDNGAGTQSIDDEVRSAMEWLELHSSQDNVHKMARYAIPSDNALGVAMRDIKAFGRTLGHHHQLARKLWETGVYEARMLASFVGDPAQLTATEMDRWCRTFDNWAICDAVSFNLFDRSPHAWSKVTQWSSRSQEFQKRAAFALLWSLTVHDKTAANEQFARGLVLIEREAGDERNFVKKAVSMALRAIGKRNRELNALSVALAQQLVASDDATARWVGRDALRELTDSAVVKRIRR